MNSITTLIDSPYTFLAAIAVAAAALIWCAVHDRKIRRIERAERTRRILTRVEHRQCRICQAPAPSGVCEDCRTFRAALRRK
jgi:hypothetical protein